MLLDILVLQSILTNVQTLSVKTLPIARASHKILYNDILKRVMIIRSRNKFT